MANVDLTRLILPEARDEETKAIEAHTYLAATDWMAIREAETGTPMPEDVRTARIRARKHLNASG